MSGGGYQPYGKANLSTRHPGQALDAMLRGAKADGQNPVPSARVAALTASMKLTGARKRPKRPVRPQRLSR